MGCGCVKTHQIQIPPGLISDGNYRLRDVYTLPLVAGYPVSGDKVAPSWPAAVRMAGSEAKAHAMVCAELIRMGRGGFCVSNMRAKTNQDFEAEDAAYLKDCRGPTDLVAGNSGADALAWKVLTLRALDGRLSRAYLDKYFVPHMSCQNCRQNLEEHLKTMPLEDVTQGSQFRWVTDFHNSVNARLERPEMAPEKAFEIWSRENEPA